MKEQERKRKKYWKKERKGGVRVYNERNRDIKSKTDK